MGSGASRSAAKQSRAEALETPIFTEPPETCLDITFVDDNGQDRRVRFKSRPLDMEICYGMTPMRVINVDRQGLAHKSGVERGWTIRRINSSDVAGKPFDDQFSMLKNALTPLPVHSLDHKADALEIVFVAGADEKEVPVIFSKKPLGFDCEVVAPIKVKSIKENCVARRSGVEVGWIVKKIDGVDISTLDIELQIKYLKESVAALPDIDYRIAPPLAHYSTTASSSNRREAPDEGSSTSDGRV